MKRLINKFIKSPIILFIIYFVGAIPAASHMPEDDMCVYDNGIGPNSRNISLGNRCPEAVEVIVFDHNATTGCHPNGPCTYAIGANSQITIPIRAGSYIGFGACYRADIINFTCYLSD